MARKSGTNRIRERRPRRARAGQPESAIALVHRRCLVCEWHGEAVEPIKPPPRPNCPWCHAPTKRVAVEPFVAPGHTKGTAKNPHAAALGRLGGLKGGVARAAVLSPQQRREIAVKAARTRWKKNGH